MHSRGNQMLSLALGKVEKKERNTVSSFSNIFGNVGLQNKELRIYFMVVYLSFFSLKIQCLLLCADNYGRLSSREYLLPLKDSKNVIVCRSMFLSTFGLKSDGMITEMAHAQRQSYDGAITPAEDRRGSHPPSNKCDAEVIRLHINS